MHYHTGTKTDYTWPVIKHLEKSLSPKQTRYTVHHVQVQLLFNIHFDVMFFPINIEQTDYNDSKLCKSDGNFPQGFSISTVTASSSFAPKK